MKHDYIQACSNIARDHVIVTALKAWRIGIHIGITMPGFLNTKHISPFKYLYFKLHISNTAETSIVTHFHISMVIYDVIRPGNYKVL